MFKRCRFSASSSSVNFWISSNNSCGISVSRKDVDAVNYDVDVAINCTLLCVGVVCGVDVFVSSSVFGL